MKEIEAALLQENLVRVGEITGSGTEDDPATVFIKSYTDNKGHRYPLKRQIERVQNALLSTNIYARFILFNRKEKKLEADLRQTLLRSEGEYIRNVFLDAGSGSVVVWIVPKTLAALKQLEKIAPTIRHFMDARGISRWEMKVTSEIQTPSRTAVLTAVRRLAPVSIEFLSADLASRGFEVPTATFLARELDALRKSGWLIRRQDGFYALTLSGLKRLGTRRNRSSPDIGRLLALGKRGD